MKIKKIAIVCRQQENSSNLDAKAWQTAQSMLPYLHERKLKAYIVLARKELSSSPQHKKKQPPRNELLKKNIPILQPERLSTVHLVIVLGGDGTYLQAVRWLKGKRVPILGVNMGGLGFLTTVHEAEAFDKLQLVLKGKMQQLARSMLSVQLKRAGRTIERAEALNDVVIERGARSQLVSLSVYTGHHHISDFKADGVVVASPTGSTAYNLACGGPILYPYGNSFVITPICAHALTNRPLIFPDSQTLVFKLHQKQKAGLVVDGQAIAQLKYGDEVQIKKSPHAHYVLRENNYNYFNVLKQKLSFGSRELNIPRP